MQRARKREIVDFPSPNPYPLKNAARVKAWDSKDKHYWDQMLRQKLASNVDEHARNKHGYLLMIVCRLLCPLYWQLWFELVYLEQ